MCTPWRRRGKAEVQYIAPFLLGGGEKQFHAPATVPQRKGASVPIECKPFIKNFMNIEDNFIV